MIYGLCKKDLVARINKILFKIIKTAFDAFDVSDFHAWPPRAGPPDATCPRVVEDSPPLVPQARPLQANPPRATGWRRHERRRGPPRRARTADARRTTYPTLDNMSG